MFIYRKEKAIHSGLCEAFIKEFERSDLKQPGILYNKKTGNSSDGKKSTDISFHPGMLQDKTWGHLLKSLIPIIEKGLADYIIRYSLALTNLDPIRIAENFNLQRYNPGENFSAWHCERASLKYMNRVLVWMVYLNDVTDRGETEFFYQKHWERPEEGKLVIWPADLTHMHRGVASPTQTKYILTGWFSHYNEEL